MWLLSEGWSHLKLYCNYNSSSQQSSNITDFSVKCDQLKDFDRNSRLVKHQESKSCLKNCEIVCPNCNMGFNNAVKLNNHLTKSHCPKKFKCDLCESYFRLESQLLVHIKNVHDLETTCVKM